jgi:proteic killer suppression protein
MIQSFRNKPLQKYFETGNSRGLSVQDSKRVGRILRSLDDAGEPEDMNLPGLRFHALVGKDRGRYSVRVTGNWRITFSWDGDNAVDVDLEDYH